MLTFKEFFKLTDLSEEQKSIAKKLYKWYLVGAKHGATEVSTGYYRYRNSDITDFDDCFDFAMDDFNYVLEEKEKEVENGKTEKN